MLGIELGSSTDEGEEWRMATAAQPFLHDLVTCFSAPTAVLSGADGQLRGTGAHGVLHADLRVLSEAVVTVAGHEAEPVAAAPGTDSGTAVFVGVVRALGEPQPDPTVLLERHRSVRPGALDERLVLVNGSPTPIEAQIALELAADLATIGSVKAGRPRRDGPPAVLDDDLTGWHAPGLDVGLLAPGGTVTRVDGDGQTGLRLCVTWRVEVAAHASADVHWGLRADDAGAVVVAARTPPAWSRPTVTADDDRLGRLVARSLQDLDGLRMATRDHPGHEFCAAGSPWYFTLFGRDSLWAARMLLPLGTELAAGTLRVLAAYQGNATDVDTGEEPGKIPHELRRSTTDHDDTALPPLYYGTVDATPLWIVLLRDAWRWGLPEHEVRDLLPSLKAALRWLVEYGDQDGDGFLEYADRGGHGLANQGWKDSGDAIRFADGSQARGPVALCEVQGYAYEAAVAGAELLDAVGEAGAEPLRQWASDLARRFREHFWVGQGSDRRPALALDGDKRPVDSVTTNIGHLLGTGILDEQESDVVARRVTAADMRSGFGLRTMSSLDAGYWPLSYHCGSVWPHDTAIVIRGLCRSGHVDRAAEVVGDLLDAAAHYDYRLPELYAGLDSAVPVPYPASCRPQAWSAAASVVLLQTVLGLEADVPRGRLTVRPSATAPVGALDVSGLRVAGHAVHVRIDRSGRVVSVDGADGLHLG